MLYLLLVPVQKLSPEISLDLTTRHLNHESEIGDKMFEDEEDYYFDDEDLDEDGIPFGMHIIEEF